MVSVIFGNRIRTIHPDRLPAKESVEWESQQQSKPTVPARRIKEVPMMHEEVLGVRFGEFEQLPAELWNHTVSCVRSCLKQLGSKVSRAYADGIDGGLSILLDETVPKIIHQLGREIMGGLLQKERGFLGTHIRCAECGLGADYQGDPQITLMTKCGKVAVGRAYYRCAAGHCFYPLDIQLGVDGEHRMLPSVQETVSLLTSRVPYAEAVETITRLLPVTLSGETAERVTATTARKLQQEQERERAELMTTTTVTLADPVAVKGNEIAILTGDGGMCKIRNQKECREFKMGVLGTVVPSPGEARPPRIDDKHYIAHLNNVDDFFEYLAVGYLRRGLHRCSLLHVLADGAGCYWNRFDSLLHPGQRISKCLDYYHATEHVTNARQAIFGSESEHGKQWYQQMCTYLYNEQFDDFFEELSSQQRRAKDDHDQEREQVIQAEVRYFSERRALLRYKQCREQGLPIGSGMVEGGIRFVGKDRLDRTGMKWSVDGAEAILQLRCLDASGRWNKYFERRSTERLQRYRDKKTAWLKAA